MPESTAPSPRRRAATIAWPAGAAIFAAYASACHAYSYDMPGLMSEHWYVMVPIGVVLACIAGRLDAGLGLAQLFRDPVAGRRDAARRPWLGPAMLGTFGATLLICQSWSAVYFSEWIEHVGSAGGGVASAHSRLFHSRGDAPIRVVDLLGDADIAAFRTHGRLLDFLGVAAPPFLLLLALAAAFPAARPEGTPEPRLRHVRDELIRMGIGMLAGLATFAALVKLGGFIQVQMEGSGAVARLLDDWVRPLLKTRAGAGPGGSVDPRRDRIASTITAGYCLFLAVNAAELAVLIQFPRRLLSPSLGIGLLCGMATIAYAVVVGVARPYQLPLVGVVAAYLAVTNGLPYKFQFPGMGDYYKPGRRLALAALEESLSAECPPPRPPHLLDDRATLEAWRASTGLVRPKLVLVTATGGAYRAGFWTAIVLDELGADPALAGLPGHIRLMAGASGGMVGAAYYAATRKPPGDGPAPRAAEVMARETGLDSLSAVVRRLIQRDLPNVALPFRPRDDRGRVLDREWPALCRPFRDLAAGEAAGWRPSLVVSPMIVESGRRLLISNLDLLGLTETYAARTESVSGRPPGPPGRLYSRSSVEFGRMFPDAPGFTVATAVRMNASFPYISPAVCLPTDPPRRVADAGYYDNYGVDIAATWAYLNRDWIAANTSGLALIQVRAYQSEARRKQIFVEGRDATVGLTGLAADWFARSVQWLTTPLEAVASARAWSMSFRNDEQIRSLDDFFNVPAQPDEPRFFETFVFEDAVEFGMNWFLSADDVARMTQTLRPEPLAAPRPDHAPASDLRLRVRRANLDEKDRLATWWDC